MPQGLARVPACGTAQLPFGLCAQVSFLVETEREGVAYAQVSGPEGAEMLRGSPGSHPSGNVDMPPHLQRRCAQRPLPPPFWFQSRERDGLNPACLRAHFLLSSRTAAFSRHKVTPRQLRRSCSDPGPSLPAPQQHHLSQLLLRATFSPHLLPSQPHACPSPAPTLPQSLRPGTARNIFL